MTSLSLLTGSTVAAPQSKLAHERWKVVRFIDRLDMTIAVDLDIKPQTKQKQTREILMYLWFFASIAYFVLTVG